MLPKIRREANIAKVSWFSNSGAFGAEDLVSEGVLLYYNIRHRYDKNKGAKFWTWFRRCLLNNYKTLAARQRIVLDEEAVKKAVDERGPLALNLERVFQGVGSDAKLLIDTVLEVPEDLMVIAARNLHWRQLRSRKSGRREPQTLRLTRRMLWRYVGFSKYRFYQAAGEIMARLEAG